MSTMRSLLAASILAASVAAQSGSSGALPPSCNLVQSELKSCIPSDATAADITGPSITRCICVGNDFDSYVDDCLNQASSDLTNDSLELLNELVGYCATYYNGGSSSGGSSSRSPTTPRPTPTQSGGSSSGGTGNTDCDYAIAGLSTCWTGNDALPTAPSEARCLCSGTGFDSAIDACYSGLVDTDPDDASTVAIFTDFCSSYSAGAFADATPTGDSGPQTSGDSGPETTGGFLDNGPPDSRVASTPSRAIQTLSPGSTSDSGNSLPATSTGSNPSQSSGSNSDGSGAPPNGAGALEVTILGTAFAALIAGAALFL
ncbi:hypothetical protein AA313_de0207644 [Arthrobotrys entomopaga]|nr:hypothetical protein AA313_de0207644 [Arthrobotrys entomopaga]